MKDSMTSAAYRATLGKPRRSEETQGQIALFDLLGRLEGRWPLVARCLHIPNGEKRDKATAARLKRLGVRAGAPDIILPIRNRCTIFDYPAGALSGLAIELKAKGGRASPAQLDWLAALADEGWYARLCFDWTEAARLIIAWCGGDPSQVEGL